MRYFDNFEDSSGIEASSTATYTMSIITTEKVPKFERKNIQATEIFGHFAWWCQE